MLLSLWFLLVAIIVLITSVTYGTILGSGWHLVIALVLAGFALLFAWQGLKVRSFAGLFPALAKSAAISFLLPAAAFFTIPQVSDFLWTHTALSPSDVLVGVIWVGSTLLVALILTVFLGRRMLRPQARASLEGNGLSRGRYYWCASLFSNSILLLLLCGPFWAAVAINYPKDPPFETQYPPEEVTEQERLAYREMLRWAVPASYEDPLHSLFPDLIDPSPGVRHPAPVPHILDAELNRSAIPGYTPIGLHLIIESSKLMDDDSDVLLAPDAATLRVMEEGEPLLQDHLRFLRDNPYRLDYYDYYLNRPYIGHNAEVLMIMIYTIRYQVEMGRCEQAAANYLLTAEAISGLLKSGHTSIELIISTLAINLLIDCGPSVLACLDSQQRKKVLETLTAIQMELPKTQKSAWVAELAMGSNAFHQMTDDNPDVLRPALADADNLELALLQFRPLFFDVNRTLKQHEQLYSPYIEATLHPYFEVAESLQEQSEKNELALQSDLRLIDRNPLGKMLIGWLFPNLDIFTVRGAVIQAQLGMLRYGIEAWETPGRLPEVPIDPTANAPFEVSLSKDRQTLLIHFATSSKLPEREIDRYEALEFPLPEPISDEALGLGKE